MKNALILVLSVVVIAVAIIAVGISISQNRHEEESSQTESTTSSITTPDTEPVTLPTEDAQTQPVAQPTQESSEPERSENESTGDIILLARSLIGTDFTDGGETPQTGFDNSGFIYYVLRESGYITCPRGVSAQSEWGTGISYSELVPGDLVFFSEGGSFAEFGGIYSGDGIMIACLMPGTQVKEVNITTDYYRGNFFRGVAIS